MTTDQIAYAVLTVGSLALLVLTVRYARMGKVVKVSDLWLLVPVLIGLVYDNAMLAFGTYLGEGRVLEWMSAPRYVLHGLCTPLLVIFAALCADRLDVPGYRDRGRLTLWGAVAFLAMLLGLVGDLVELDLNPVMNDGVLSYKNATSGPPIAEILTVVALLIIGGTMQRYARWPWIFVGAAQMFVLAAFFLENGQLQNVGEIVLLSCCLATGALCVQRVRAERDARRTRALKREVPASASSAASDRA